MSHTFDSATALQKDGAGPRPVVTGGDERFFLRIAIVMSLVIVCGFLLQLLMGRSSFASPVRVHIHAILFMGWMVIFLTQSFLAASGRLAQHRKLGWLASGWMLLMVISGTWVTVVMVRNATVPFFFQPLQFLVFDPFSLYAFAGLTVGAIMLRRQTAWHRRLHVCAMSLLLGPAFGRMLPMPLLQPWAWEMTFAASLVFLLVVVWRDARRNGSVHPAWKRGIAVVFGLFVATEVVSYSPVGTVIYQHLTKGSPGAAVAPLEFGTPPSGKQITGRS